jgi:hypothetical protein
MHCIAKRLLLVSLCFISCSCATARLANQGNIKAPIEMNAYRINITDEKSWKDWEASTKSENDTLVLKKLKIWPLNGEVQGITTMSVIRDSIAPQGWNLTETEHADNVRTIEEKIMREKGPVEGKYDIQELTKSDLLRNGKKLYVMTWTASQRSEGLADYKRKFFGKGAMYLYFPEGYKDTHRFYRFVIVDSIIPPTIMSVNLEQIYPIIDGFAMKQ